MHRSWIALAALAACQHAHETAVVAPAPRPTTQIGSCAGPGRDGVISAAPRIERADRDLNGDGIPEALVVDRALCSAAGNCYWNVFIVPPAGAGECARYAGTFEAGALEPLATKGDDNMADVRGYWNLHGSRLLLQTYRFLHGGYRLVDALICLRGRDDKLDCAGTD